jgi:hypothetical protein
MALDKKVHKSEPKHLKAASKKTLFAKKAISKKCSKTLKKAFKSKS